MLLKNNSIINFIVFEFIQGFIYETLYRKWNVQRYFFLILLLPKFHPLNQFMLPFTSLKMSISSQSHQCLYYQASWSWQYCGKYCIFFLLWKILSIFLRTNMITHHPVMPNWDNLELKCSLQLPHCDEAFAAEWRSILFQLTTSYHHS